VTAAHDPALAAIVVGDSAATLAPLFKRLDAQTAKDRLELVVVAPPGAHPELRDAAPDGTAGVRLVAREPLEPLAGARAAGIRAARAPVVALTETHSFPAPGWAAALIDAHRGPWGAVGPTFGNANPRHALSWANLLLDYGPFLARAGRSGSRAAERLASESRTFERELRARDQLPPGSSSFHCEVRETDRLPGHNSSFKRDALLACGSALDELLGAEPVLHAGLRRRGHRLAIALRAHTDHVNVTRRRTWLVERWHCSRDYAAGRSSGWSRRRRAAYAAGWPLIPPLRLARAVAQLRACGELRRLPRLVHLLAVALTAQSLGEAVGYTLGAGDAHERLGAVELHRLRHVRAGEAAALADPDPAGMTALSVTAAARDRPTVPGHPQERA
jgi:hypothetical protein